MCEKAQVNNEEVAKLNNKATHKIIDNYLLKLAGRLRYNYLYKSTLKAYYGKSTSPHITASDLGSIFYCSLGFTCDNWCAIPEDSQSNLEIANE